MLRVWHGLCQQLRGRCMGTRGSGFWPCPAHPQGQRLKSRRESSGSVTGSVWKFLLTPQTAALEPPGPCKSVSYRSGPTSPHPPPPARPSWSPSDPSGCPTSHRTQNHLFPTPAPGPPVLPGSGPPTNRPSAAGGKRTVKVYCGHKGISHLNIHPRRPSSHLSLSVKYCLMPMVMSESNFEN